METHLRKFIFDGPVSKPNLYDTHLVNEIENKKIKLTAFANSILELRQTYAQNYLTKMVKKIKWYRF